MFVNAMAYNCDLGRLGQMTEQEAVKVKDEAILKKECRDNVQLPAKFEDHRTAFLEIVG